MEVKSNHDRCQQRAGEENIVGIWWLENGKLRKPNQARDNPFMEFCLAEREGAVNKGLLLLLFLIWDILNMWWECFYDAEKKERWYMKKGLVTGE